MQSFILSFSANLRFQTCRASKGVRAELRWWNDVLNAKPIRKLTLSDTINNDLELWVDASSDFGIGIVIAHEWLAWKWIETWDGFGKAGMNIGWAEMVGIELLVRCLITLGKHDGNFFIRSDNKGAIDAIKKGSLRNIPSNQSIIRINALRIPLNIDISPAFIASLENRADPVSRGDFSGLPKSPIVPDLPRELAAILCYV